MYIKSVFWKPRIESHVLLSLVVCSRQGNDLETLDGRVVSRGWARQRYLGAEQQGIWNTELLP